jgi:4-hydroxy-3-polyprenylbenzoate decarboxylase
MKIVVAITGASGALYADLLIKKLLTYPPVEVSVVLTKNAKQIFVEELGRKLEFSGHVNVYENSNFYAPFASGSANFDKMVVCPCSMGKLAKISNGISDDLITRAADVFLKESKSLILIPRETPMNLIHLENMKKVMLAGATIVPANPSFYSKPSTIDELVMTVVDRIVDHLGLKNDNVFRWGR